MPPFWKDELAGAYRSSAALLAALQLPTATDSPSSFPVLCTRHYARKMLHEATDPLLRQVLATDAENQQAPGFVNDPVGDTQACVEPGILHKYQGRLLLVSTGACAIHCRFCFRRNYPYGQSSPQDIASRLKARIEQDSTIQEVILSGGDPLLLDDSKLEELLQAASHSRILRLRIHSRVPITLPSRFTEELFSLLANLGSRLVFVLHCNHHQELDEASSSIFARLRSMGALLLNQSVLLAGVNDSAPALAQLSEDLFQQGVLPYYLHQLDRVRGAVHFEVPESRASTICQELRTLLPGYLVPLWVKEEPGEPSKTPLGV